MDLSQDVQLYLKRDRAGFDLSWIKNNSHGRSLEEPKSLSSFIDFWIHLPYPSDCRERFVETMKAFYNGDDAKLRMLHDFELNYNSEHAIHWYTRETFLYSVLNRALRQQNIALIFLFGFFIQDLHQQLQREYQASEPRGLETKSTLYRGQTMSASEIREQLHPLAPLDPKIINNSLFSATSNRSLALGYVNPDANPDDRNSEQNVLFEFDISSSHHDKESFSRRPFADVSHLSQFDSEEETLFMIGTNFRFNRESIHYNAEEHVWIFKFALDNQYFDIYENEFNCVSKRKALKRSINLLLNANRRRAASISFPLLENIFQELTEMYPMETNWLSAMNNHCLAVYEQFVEENYEQALTHYYKALNFWHSYMTDEELNCLRDLGEIHRQIAEILQFKMNDSEQAKINYDTSIEYYQLAISKNLSLSNYEHALMYKALARLYERKTRLNDCREQQLYLSKIKYWELHFEKIFHYYPPINTVRTWSVLPIIADSYRYIGDIEKAIAYYELALALREGLFVMENYTILLDPFDGILPLIDIYRHLITLYRDHKGNYQSALNYWLILYEYELKYGREYGNHGPEEEKKLLARLHSDLGDIYRRSDEYSLANEHFKRALCQYKKLERTDSVEWDIKCLTEQVRESHSKSRR